MTHSNLRRSVCFSLLAPVAFVVASFPLAAGSTDNDPDHRPNIIFFFTDDMGWGDMKNAGHPYLKTPNFDRLAKEGTRFDQFYSAASVCSPSRAAFMTGNYPARHHIHQHFSGHRQNSGYGMPDWLDPKADVVTRQLKKAGYRTGHFGKWHLGHVEGAPEPGAYGIDEYRSLAGTGPGWDRNGKPADTDLAHASYGNARNKDYFWTHSTDLIVDQAIAFIEKGGGQPFYLNLWAWLPHAPNCPTPEQLESYRNLEARPQDFESWMRDYAGKAEDIEGQMRTYCAAMTGIDTALGRLLDKLDELDISDNTLILVTSDNGPEDYQIGNMRNSGMGSTGPFRGRKRSLYEGGIRMPCIVRQPGVIPAGRVDKTSILGAVDWFPTVCRIANIPVSGLELDGEDVTDILRGSPRNRHRPLFWEWRGIVVNKAYEPPGLAVRDGDWKLFAQPDGTRVELYHIPQDPEERANVAGQNPKVVNRLLPQLLAWKKTLPE